MTVSELGSLNSRETCSLESETGSFRGTALIEGKSRIGLAEGSRWSMATMAR